MQIRKRAIFLNYEAWFGKCEIIKQLLFIFKNKTMELKNLTKNGAYDFRGEKSTIEKSTIEL